MTSKKKDLYNLADGWLELESDPGLFTLLLEDMGVEGTQVGWADIAPSSVINIVLSPGGGDLRPAEGAPGGGRTVLRGDIPLQVD